MLIDTHVFLWFESGSPKLSAPVRDQIMRSGQRVYLSAASIWEIAIKQRAGKLDFDGSPRSAARASGLLELPISAADAELAGSLVWEHRDPFDRILVAQCLNRALALVTADQALRARRDVAIIWAG